jgi:hypothetical protein
MRITFIEEKAKQSITKELKKFNADRLYINYTFDIENKKGNIQINATKKYYDKEVTCIINKEVTTEYNTSIERIFISDIYTIDVLLDFLIAPINSIDCYSHNLDNLRFKDNDTNYFIDTIVIRVNNKSIKHDAISFNTYKMIYARSC